MKLSEVGDMDPGEDGVAFSSCSSTPRLPLVRIPCGDRERTLDCCIAPTVSLIDMYAHSVLSV